MDFGTGSRHTASISSQEHQRRTGSLEAPSHRLSAIQFFGSVGGAISLPVLAPYFLDWLAHPSYDEYWKQLSLKIATLTSPFPCST